MPEWACRKKPARTRRSWLSSWLAASCAFDLVGVQKLLSLLRPSYYHGMFGQNVVPMQMQQCLLSASQPLTCKCRVWRDRLEMMFLCRATEHMPVDRALWEHIRRQLEREATDQTSNLILVSINI